MTITRISEVIHSWLGWCPNGHTMRSSAGEVPLPYAQGPGVKTLRPSGTDGAGKAQDWWYEHSQRGLLIIGAVTAAIVMMVVLSFLFGFVWITALILCIMVVVLAICSTLTVAVCDNMLRIRFGPVPLIRKRWPVAEITSVATVINPWYYGWGIRWTPHGPLYNVSGYGAVEVTLNSGKKFRIGTDEPDALCRAIGQARDKNR